MVLTAHSPFLAMVVKISEKQILVFHFAITGL